MTDRPAHVPAGHATLAPYVMAQGARDLVAFLTQVFDARVVMSLDRDDGSLMHASLQIGESSLMLAEATADYPAFPVWLHVYVADAGETYAKAIALGATGIEAPWTRETAIAAAASGMPVATPGGWRRPRADHRGSHDEKAEREARLFLCLSIAPKRISASRTGRSGEPWPGRTSCARPRGCRG